MPGRIVSLLVRSFCVVGMLGGGVVSAASTTGYPPAPRCPAPGDCDGYAATVVFRIVACPPGTCLALTLTGTGFSPDHPIGYRVPMTVVRAGVAEPAVAYGVGGGATPDGAFTVDTGEVPCQPGERLTIDPDEGYVIELASGKGTYLLGATATC